MNHSSPSGLFSDAGDQEEEYSPSKPTAHVQVEAEELIVAVLPSAQNDRQCGTKEVVGLDEESEDDGGLGDELAFGLEELRSTQAAIATDDDDSDEEDMVEVALMEDQAVPQNAPFVGASAYDGDESDSETDFDSDSDDEY